MQVIIVALSNWHQEPGSNLREEQKGFGHENSQLWKHCERNHES